MTDDPNELIENIDKIHTTEMGVERIRKNLFLADINVVEWCRARIMNQGAIFFQKGKNWYIDVDGYVITVNKSSYTIITAHKR